MANKTLLVVLIIVVLILGAVSFTIAISALDKDSFIRWGDNQEKEYSNRLTHNPVSQRSACNFIDNLPCFKYSGVELTKLESFKYPKVEQTRLNPCLKPKPVCPVCREKLEQLRGEGHIDKIIQTRIEC
jgi:hypothetical protein